MCQDYLIAAGGILPLKGFGYLYVRSDLTGVIYVCVFTYVRSDGGIYVCVFTDVRSAGRYLCVCSLM